MTAPTPSRVLLRPHTVAELETTGAAGWRLSQAASIQDVIDQLADSNQTEALRLEKRVSLSLVSGQADVEQCLLICELLVQNCPNLLQLELPDVVLSAKAAHALAQLPKLALLNINSHNVSTRALRPLHSGVLESLAQSPSLARLVLGNTDLPQGGVRPLAQLATLRSLALSNCAFFASDEASISAIQSLEEFYHIGDGDVQAIIGAATGLSRLQRLYLNSFTSTGKTVDIAPLQTLRHLRRLYVVAAELKASTMRAVGKGCPVLQELMLNRPVSRAPYTLDFRLFTKLQTLEIFNGIDGVLGRTAGRQLLHLRRARLGRVRIPADHLSSHVRRDLLAAFGNRAMTYTPGSPMISSDRAWLLHKQYLREGEIFPIWQ